MKNLSKNLIFFNWPPYAFVYRIKVVEKYSENVNKGYPFLHKPFPCF